MWYSAALPRRSTRSRGLAAGSRRGTLPGHRMALPPLRGYRRTIGVGQRAPAVQTSSMDGQQDLRTNVAHSTGFLAADDVLREGGLGRKVGPGFYDYGKVVS